MIILVLSAGGIYLTLPSHRARIALGYWLGSTPNASIATGLFRLWRLSNTFYLHFVLHLSKNGI